MVTDEWLSEGKLLIGSENRTAFVKLDLTSNITMFTGFDCDRCPVKTYSSTGSLTKKDNPLRKETTLSYNRTTGLYIPDNEALFTGYWVRDRICFNGVVDRLNCTARTDNGHEFFVVTDTDEDSYFSNSLFSGILGLGVGQSFDLSLPGYLKNTK